MLLFVLKNMNVLEYRINFTKIEVSSHGSVRERGNRGWGNWGTKDPTKKKKKLKL